MKTKYLSMYIIYIINNLKLAILLTAEQLLLYINTHCNVNDKINK